MDVVSRPDGAGIDPRVASPARMYDYYLGGKDNNAADREAAEQALAVVPEGSNIARDNRAFLLRAVDHLAGTVGVDQFLDFGTGILTSPNVHEIARRHIPGARVVYVDRDPVVNAHNRALRATHDGVVGIAGDLRDPAAIFADPDCRRVLDPSRPVAVICVAVFHFVTDDHDAAILQALHEHMPSGSHLVLSVMTGDHQPAAKVDGLRDAYRGSTAPATIRSDAQIAALFDGFDLIAPGLVLVNDWRPDTTRAPDTRWLLAGVGTNPDRPPGYRGHPISGASRTPTHAVCREERPHAAKRSDGDRRRRGRNDGPQRRQLPGHGRTRPSGEQHAE